MKILWWSNAPWARTGYGTQTKINLPRIAKLGHDVSDIGCNWGLGGNTLTLGDGSRVWPLGWERHGNDILPALAAHVKADIVITLYDSWCFKQQATSRMRWCPWLPIDHDPAPPAVLDALKSAWKPICYSKFGVRKLKEAGLDPAYVPHSIEMEVYKPLDRAEARAKFRLSDDVFFAVMVAANKGTPSRKAFNEALLAWKAFHERRADSHLYMHTHFGPEITGLDLRLLVKQAEILPDSVSFCDPFQNVVGVGYDERYMVDLYNAADVLLNPTMGEGFGLPILEAQACGTPVIVGDWTSMPEICFSGWKVRGQPFWTPMGSWQFVPFIGSILNALDKAYTARGSERLRKKARKGAVAYDADLVAEKYWKPVLAEIEAEISQGAVQEAVSLSDWDESSHLLKTAGLDPDVDPLDVLGKTPEEAAQYLLDTLPGPPSVKVGE